MVRKFGKMNPSIKNINSKNVLTFQTVQTVINGGVITITKLFK